MMQLAEVIYHNQQAMLKLPSNFKPIQKTWYVAQNEQTGQAMITTCQPEWNDFLQAWQQLDGTEWDELTRYRYDVERSFDWGDE